MYDMVGDVEVWITLMEVELARMRPLEVELTIIRVTLATWDSEVASLSHIVKCLQDRLTMPILEK